MTALLQLLLFFATFQATEPLRTNEAQDKIFRVYFQQDHKTIEATDEIFLKREPFDIVFEFPEPMGVLVHASLSPETYDLAVKSKPMKKLPGFVGTGMAEENFNKDNDVMLSASAPSYWFYDSDTAHRFNEIAVEKNKTIVCKRHVEQLTDIDSNRVVKIADVAAPLNLVFISTEQTDGTKEQTELNRVAVKVNWTE